MKKQGLITVVYNGKPVEFKIERVRSMLAAYKLRLRRLEKEASKLSGYRRDAFVTENDFESYNKAITDGEFILSHAK
jgi:hypothetical protein